jgi:endoglucanase
MRECCRSLLLVLLLAAVPALAADADTGAGDDPDLSWWSAARKGANCQNETVEPEYWRAASAAGIEFIRLVPDGWASEQRDFLIGDADAFVALVPADLQTLRGSLDDAHAAGVGVVLTCFSLPGARWRQLNGGEDDYRLWNEPNARTEAVAFWTQLAAALQGHPAVVAYNPLNEPHPEREHGVLEADFGRWQVEIEGTLADVNRFNREIVAAIREVDATTPILLDGGHYASPLGLTNLVPVEDPAVLYAFHFYEPWVYVTYRVNEGRFRYPDSMPEGWNAVARRESLTSVAAWAGRHHIEPRRIVLSEFGCDRRVGGAAAYLDDLLTDVARWDWHWAFYAFRGDGSWGGLDYELGTENFDGAYWAAVEGGADPETLKQRGPNPLWEVLGRRLKDAP